MKVTEISVKGLKRKAFRKEKAKEKADRDRLAKKVLIDSIWRAGAKIETAAAAKRKEKEILDRKEMVKIKPNPPKISSKKVQVSKNRSSIVKSSRFAKMWADQCKTKPQPAVETKVRGLKMKMFNLDGGVAKAGRMGPICVHPCLCPADRMGGDTAADEENECSGAAGREEEMQSQTGPVEMPSQTGPMDKPDRSC